MTQTTNMLLKPTHIPWIEKIPETWKSLPIRGLFYESNIRSTSGTETLLSVSQYTGVTKRGDNLDLEVDNLTNAETLEGYKIVAKDDLVINIMLAWNGSLAVSDFDGITSPAYSIFKAKAECFPKYYHYLFRTDILQSEFKRHSTGIIDSRLRLYPDVFLRLPIIKPPFSIQIAIVNFIDQKTEKISTLISNKKKLISLLKEQKQSIIHRAVTKGIDKNVKMKDSGVSWIGEIPEDWEVKRLKYATETRVSNVDKKSEDEIKVQLCNYVDVYKNDFIDESIDFMNATATEQQISRFRLKEGDVVITKDSETADDIGVPAYVKLENNINVVCGYHLAICSSKESVLLGQFLFRLFQSKFLRSYFEVSCNGVTRFGLDIYSIINAVVLLPPLSIQKAIVEYIEHETSKIDTAIAKIEKEITLIEEYRASLVYQAVTGKITIS